MNKKIIIPTILGSLVMIGVISTVSAHENFIGGNSVGIQGERRSIEDCQNRTFEDWKTEHQARTNNMQEELDSMDEATWNKMKEYREALRTGDSSTAESLKEELGIKDGDFGMMRGKSGFHRSGDRGYNRMQ